MNDISNICEELQRLEFKNKSLDVLERVYNTNPELFDIECEYQNYCQQFSETYVSGSCYYVGDSMVEHIINKNGLFNLFSTLFGIFMVKSTLRNRVNLY